MRSSLLLLVAACRLEHPILATDASNDGAATDAISQCAVEVVAAGSHTCARTGDGRVACWGDNSQGQAGVSPTETAMCNINGQNRPCVKGPTFVTLPRVATGLGAGDQATCVLANGSTYCFGANDTDQFGNGGGDTYVPVEITVRIGAIEIAGSELSMCSLANAELTCAGGNMHGEVGNGTTTASSPFVPMSDSSRFAMGYQNTCAVTNGAVYCWGANDHQQVDSTTTLTRTSPVLVSGVNPAVDVTIGLAHACALQATGTVQCWGNNAQGQHGAGMASVSTTPTYAIIDDAVQIDAGINQTCARSASGTVSCWGESFATAPQSIPLVRPAISITTGSYHACAALDDGSVWCWGYNGFGQLGTGTSSTMTSNNPVRAQLCQ